MNNLPIDLLVIIGNQLSIPTLKQIAESCSKFHNQILNYYFLKSYILVNFPEYTPCSEELAKEQLIYLYKFSKKNICNIHHLSYSPQLGSIKYYHVLKNKLNYKINQILHPKLKIGDIFLVGCDFSKDRRLVYIYYGENILKMLKNTSSDMLKIPKKIKFIDEIPLNYYENVRDKFIYYFDISPYLEQVQENIKKISENGTTIHYIANFRHKFGKTYTISCYISHKNFYDLDKIIMIISKGYFFSLKLINVSWLAINDHILEYITQKYLKKFHCKII